MDSLRVLITSIHMSGRSGGVLYVRDLALRLLRLGHHPVVYTPNPGPAADDLRRATIPVIDDLSRLGAPPDVIHGNQAIETLTALLQFPEAPAIFVCHGWNAWVASPPRLERVIRYVAVDDTCADQLQLVDGIPPDRVEVILNWVDLDRFLPREALPPVPERALVFSNQAQEDGSHLPAVRDACQRLGIAVDAIGYGVGASVERPETVLPRYDLVFAKAKCALEAIAVGCAVVVCDDRGLGPMVTTAEFDRLRRLNFGARTLQSPVDPDAVMTEIKRYDPVDAAAVSQGLRAEAGLDRAANRLVALYRQVIAEAAGQAGDPVADARAAARHLRLLNQRLLAYDGIVEDARVLSADKERLRGECDRLNAELARLQARLETEADGRERAEALLDETSREAEALRRRYEALSDTATFRVRAGLLDHPVAGPILRGTSRLRRRISSRPPG